MATDHPRENSEKHHQQGRFFCVEAHRLSIPITTIPFLSNPLKKVIYITFLKYFVFREQTFTHVKRQNLELQTFTEPLLLFKE